MSPDRCRAERRRAGSCTDPLAACCRRGRGRRAKSTYWPGSRSRRRASSPSRSPPRQSSASSLATGWTCRPARSWETLPASNESTAGSVSEGLKAVDESATAESRLRVGCPNVIAHGTRNAPEPRGWRTISPSAEPVAGGTPRRRATRRTVVEPPGLSRTCRGNAWTCRPVCPSLRIRTRKRRDETLCSVSRCVECQPSPRARPKARVSGHAASSADGRRAEVDEPAALRGHARVGQRLGGSREQAPQVRRAEAGPQLGEQGRRTGHDRGRAARAVDRAVARRAVVVAAGLGGREHDSRRGEIGLHARVEGEAARGEGRDLLRGAVDRRVRQPDRDHGRPARRERGGHEAADPAGNADDRDVHLLVEAEAARGQLRPVDDDRPRRPPAPRPRSRASGRRRPGRRRPCPRRGSRRARRRSLRDGLARARRRRAALPARARTASRSDGARERQPPVEQQPEPGADRDGNVLGPGTQVGGADASARPARRRGWRCSRRRARRDRRSRQGRRRACRGRARRRPRGPRASRQRPRTGRPRRRARSAPRRARRRRDSGRPRARARRSAGRFARTRPSRRSCPAASRRRGSAAPTRRPRHRRSRRARRRRPAGRPSRSRAPRAGSARRVGDGLRAAAHLGVDQVDAGEDPAAEIRMGAVDAGVEQGDRDAAPVVAGQRAPRAGCRRRPPLPSPSSRDESEAG